ncbi:MAG: UvrD-helicase domain-containing protein, partial [Tidjanibacter sp.]|nr:UvrD-helicase domain-containing protein [Tidjanibacter sp.]
MGKVKIIKASAGSGKTYRLALEYIVRVLQEPTLYRHILAVTFTNKATEEMKQRILDYINNLAHGEDDSFMENVLLRSGLSRSLAQERAAEVLNLILHDYDSFAVLTIDKFFQRIIRSFVRELSIDINYNLELKTDTLLDLGADRLIEDLATDKDLRQWTFDYINENITEGKPYNLKESITSLGKQLFSESYRAVQTGDNPRLSLAALNKAAHAEAATCRKRQVELAEEIISNLSSQGVTLDMLHYGSRGVGGYLTKAIGGEQPTTNSYILATLSEGKWLATSHAKKMAIGDTATLGDRLGKLIEAVRATTIAENSASVIEKHYRTYAL